MDSFTALHRYTPTNHTYLLTPTSASKVGELNTYSKDIKDSREYSRKVLILLHVVIRSYFGCQALSHSLLAMAWRYVSKLTKIISKQQQSV